LDRNGTHLFPALGEATARGQGYAIAVADGFPVFPRAYGHHSDRHAADFFERIVEELAAVYVCLAA
jgi:hypothetical protein